MDSNKVLHLAWVLKKSRNTNHWNRRWVVLRNCQLSYYKSSSEHKPRKVIPREDILSYARTAKTSKYEFSVYTSKRVFHFRAETEEDYAGWCQALDEFFQDEQYSNDEEKEEELKTSLAGISTEQEADEYFVEEGELQRHRNRYNQWKKFYLIVTNKNLYYCKSSDKTQRAEKALSVEDLVDIVEVDPIRGKKWCLLLITNTKSYQLSASSEAEMTKFFSAIKAVILTHRNRREREGSGCLLEAKSINEIKASEEAKRILGV